MSILANKRFSKGFSLIEVMVALMILSVGLLGLLAMQTIAMKGNAGGYARTQAVLLAYDIIDRIRANSDGFSKDYYNNISGAPGTAPAACTNCSDIQRRDLDQYQWKQSIASMLPSGTGSVVSPFPASGTAGKNFLVTVRWLDTDEAAIAIKKGSGDGMQQVAISFEL